MSAAATFAFGAGLLATVNPCGFALLPSFLTLYLSSGEAGERSMLARGAQGFRVGLALTAGFASMFVIAGLILSLGLRSFMDIVPWAAIAIAAALALLGVAMLCGRHVGFTAASRVRIDGRRADGCGRVMLFGASYAIASLSCTIAIFLIVVSQAAAVANPLRVIAVFGSYAAGAATVLVALSLSVALAKATVARAVGWFAPAINRLAGALLIASGAYLVIYWLPTLQRSSTRSTPGVVHFTERISAALESFFSAHTPLFLALLGALIALGAALWLTADRREGDAFGQVEAEGAQVQTEGRGASPPASLHLAAPALQARR
jgi:cytochrome c-type biogenesis protein